MHLMIKQRLLRRRNQLYRYKLKCLNLDFWDCWIMRKLNVTLKGNVAKNSWWIL